MVTPPKSMVTYDNPMTTVTSIIDEDKIINVK